MSLGEGAEMAGGPAAGFVLAGGRSSRMGTDKALILLGGRPLIAHALDILRGAGLSASLAGAGAGLERFAQVVADEEPDRGPLGGICSALAMTPAAQAVFLPVDMPFLPPSLILYLIGHAVVTGVPVTVTAVSGAVQPFPVVIGRATLPVLKDLLDAGRGGCLSAFEAAAAHFGQQVAVLPVEILVQCGQVVHPRGGLPAALWFLNVNTPEGFRRASAVHDCLHRVS